MKKKMPSEGLRLGRDSGSILCDTLKKWRFRTGWGGTHSSNWNYTTLKQRGGYDEISKTICDRQGYAYAQRVECEEPCEGRLSRTVL